MSAECRTAWLGGIVALILLATLTPEHEAIGIAFPRISTGLPEHAGAIRDAVQNVVLYFPLGFVIAAGGGRLLAVSLAAVALSGTTELLQLIVPGRDPAVIDVVTNALGAQIGAMVLETTFGRRIVAVLRGLYAARNRLFHPEEMLASRMFLVWSMIVAAVVLTTSWLLRPAPPPPAFYAVSGPSLDRAAGPLRIGSDGVSGGRFRGLIDEVRIYGSALTADEVGHDMGRRVAGDTSSSELIASYGFDESGGVIVEDDSGHGHNGVLEGGRRVPTGRFGRAVWFDGHSSAVTIPASRALDLTNGFTLEAWIFPDELPARPTIIARDGDVYYLTASSDAGRLRAAGGGHFGGVPVFSRLVRPLPSRKWTHVALTYDGQDMRMYVNGTLAILKRQWSSHTAHSMELNGGRLPYGLLEDPSALHRALLNDFHFSLMIRCGSLEERPARIVTIVGPGSIAPMTLASSGRDLDIRVTTRASRFGAATPSYRVDRALTDCAQRRELPVVMTGPWPRLRVEVGGREVRVWRPGIGTGWAFIIHAELMPTFVRHTVVVMWIWLLLLPLALWARHSPRTWIGGAIIAAATAIGWTVGQLPFPNLIESAAAVTAGAAGLTARLVAH